MIEIAGILIGGLVGIIIVCAIEVVRGYFFDAKMKRQEERHKQQLMWEFEWNLRYSGLCEEEIIDVLKYLQYRWNDADRI